MHRLWGKIYFWCMAVVACSALILSVYLPIVFLALVAIFSFYAAFSAYRVLGQKAAWKGDGSLPHWIGLPPLPVWRRARRWFCWERYGLK